MIFYHGRIEHINGYAFLFPSLEIQVMNSRIFFILLMKGDRMKFITISKDEGLGVTQLIDQTSRRASILLCGDQVAKARFGADAYVTDVWKEGKSTVFAVKYRLSRNKRPRSFVL